MNVAIIVAAGTSRRMGFDKLFAPLGERPVIAHTFQAFQECTHFDEIFVITSKERFLETRELQSFYQLKKITQILEGGKARHHSVWAGLQALPSETKLVAIHDGARPLITQQDIAACLKLAVEHGAAACAHRINETVKRADAELRVTGGVDRTNLWAMETPQIFRADLIREAYEKVMSENIQVTDEVSALESIGETVILSANHSANPKITYPRDLEQAEQLLRFREDRLPSTF